MMESNLHSLIHALLVVTNSLQFTLNQKSFGHKIQMTQPGARVTIFGGRVSPNINPREDLSSDLRLANERTD